MPKKTCITSTQSYQQLTDAIANAAVRQVKKLVRRANIAHFINHDAKNALSPPPLLQALTPSHGKVSVAIVKALLSVVTINVNLKQPKTDKTLAELLTAAHLAPDIKADILALMIKRGLKIEAPQNITKNLTSAQIGNSEVNTYALIVKRSLENTTSTKVAAKITEDTIQEVNTHALLIDTVDEDYLLVPTPSLATPLTTTAAVLPSQTGLWAWFGYTNPPPTLSNA